MDKPITIILDEFKNNIVNIINDTNISLAVLYPILKQITDEAKITLDIQTKKDYERYNNFLAEQEQARQMEEQDEDLLEHTEDDVDFEVTTPENL